MRYYSDHREDYEYDYENDYERSRRGNAGGSSSFVLIFVILLLVTIIIVVIVIKPDFKLSIPTIIKNEEGTTDSAGRPIPKTSAVDLLLGKRKIFISPSEEILVHDSTMFQDINYRQLVYKFNSPIGWQDNERNTASVILDNWNNDNKIGARGFPGDRHNKTMYDIMTAPDSESAKKLALRSGP